MGCVVKYLILEFVKLSQFPVLGFDPVIQPLEIENLPPDGFTHHRKAAGKPAKLIFSLDNFLKILDIIRIQDAFGIRFHRFRSLG